MRPKARWKPGALRGAVLLLLMMAVAGASRVRGAEAPKRIKLSITDFSAAQTAAGDEPGIAVSKSGSGREQLRQWVQEWRQGIEEGNDAEAADLVPRMKELLTLEGVKEKETVLGALVALGTDWALGENWPAAAKAFEAALTLDPDHAPALLGQAKTAWRKETGPKRFIGTLAKVLQATKASLSQALGLLRATANAGLVLAMTLSIAVGGFSVVILAKYNRMLRHGALEALQDRVPEGVDRVLAWGVVFLPMLLFLTPPYWAVYWLVLLRGYGTPSERRMTLMALACIALIPVLFHLVSVTASLQQDPVLRAVSALEREDVTPDVLEAVGNMKELRDMPEAHFLVARMYEASQRSEDAVNAYTAIAETSGRDTRALVNRGNIHFRRGDYAAAIADYKKAFDQNPSDVMALRNGHVALNQSLQTEEAASWLTRAQKIDRDAVRRWSEIGPDVVVDAVSTREELAAILLKEHESFLGDVAHRCRNPVTLAALAGIIACFVITRRGLGILESVACQKCGRAFCARCHAAAKSSAYCTQCTHLYVKKDGVSPVVRTAKLREVERWTAINGLAVRFFNLAIPGAGSIYANRVSSGTLLMLLWAVAVSLLAAPTRARMVADPARLGEIDLAVFFGLEVGLLLVVYLIAILQSLRHAD